MKKLSLYLSLLFSINAIGQSITLTPSTGTNAEMNINGVKIGGFAPFKINSGTSSLRLQTNDIDRLYIAPVGTSVEAGNIGINTFSPISRLHVVKDGLSGINPSVNHIFYVENNATSYLGIGVPNGSESGITFGKPASGVFGGGIFYSALNDMSLRTGGNNTRMLITSAGNVSIGTGATPTEKLEINGTSKIGINGTPITEIIKVTRTANIASTPAGTESSLTFQIPDVQVGSTVYISPSLNLPVGLIITHALSALNSVEVKFFNASAVTVNPPSMDFYITVIR